jgi:hypothetical protein
MRGGADIRGSAYLGVRQGARTLLRPSPAGRLGRGEEPVMIYAVLVIVAVLAGWIWVVRLRYWP